MLAAADDAVARGGLAALSIDGAARAVGVSRATAYRMFSGREDLLIALGLRRATRYIDETQALMSAQVGLASQLEAGFVHLTRALPDDQVIGAMFALRSTPMADPRVRELAVEFLAPFIDAGRHNGEVRQELDVVDVIAWLIDQLFVLVNSNIRGPEMVVARVRNFIVPSITGHARTPADPALLAKLRSAQTRLEAVRSAFDDIIEFAELARDE
nr:TetR/AcrR family transcriptional regulator [Mycobacterium eburneum]